MNSYNDDTHHDECVLQPAKSSTSPKMELISNMEAVKFSRRSISFLEDGEKVMSEKSEVTEKEVVEI